MTRQELKLWALRQQLERNKKTEKEDRAEYEKLTADGNITFGVWHLGRADGLKVWNAAIEKILEDEK